MKKSILTLVLLVANFGFLSSMHAQSSVPSMPEEYKETKPVGVKKIFSAYLVDSLDLFSNEQKPPAIDFQFTIEADGKASNFECTKGADENPDLAKHLEKRITETPKWDPAQDIDNPIVIKGLFYVDNADKTTRSIEEGCMFICFEEIEHKTSSNKKAYVTAEQMPEFPGGEEAMHNFIKNTASSPTISRENGSQGRVTLRFIIDDDGSIIDITVMRGVDYHCDKEAVRVVKAMPKWIPGKQNGVNVPVYFKLPIIFRSRLE